MGEITRISLRTVQEKTAPFRRLRESYLWIYKVAWVFLFFSLVSLQGYTQVSYSGLSNVIISGASKPASQSVTISNCTNVTFTGFTFSGTQDDCFTAQSGTLSGLKFINNTATNVHGRFLMLGGWNSVLSNNTEIGCNYISGTDNSDVMFLGNAHGVNLHHNQFLNIGFNVAGSENSQHAGVVFIRFSDGNYYNNIFNGFGGNPFRVWGRTATGSTRATVNVYNNIAINGVKYSFVEAQGQTVGTNSFDCYIYNNTTGNLLPGNYISAGLTIYDLTGSTVSFTNNIVFATSAGAVSQEGGAPTSVAGTVYYSSRNAAGWASDAAIRLPDGGNWSDGGTCTSPPPVTPAAPTLASPANGATNQSTTPTLSWQSSSGATDYFYQVASDVGFNTIVQSGATGGGTSITLSALAQNTTYYWRVNASNSVGASSYTSGRSFTTNNATVPSAPSITSPTNGATGVSTTVTVTWGSVATATGYRLQASYSTDFTTPIYDNSGITGTSQTETVENGVSYYLRLAAINGAGQSAWSSTISFTTGNAAPAAPTVFNPSSGATNVATDVFLGWSASAGATSYNLQVSYSATFASFIVNATGITSLQQQMTALNNNTLVYWRVSATGPGGTSAYSATQSFTTVVAAPSAPTISSPTNGATNVSVNPTISWGSVATATSYRLTIATDAGLDNIVYDQTGITGTSQLVSGSLVNDVVYYVKVLATNLGGASNYGASVSFRTIVAAPSAPILSSPANGATDISLSPNLIWIASSGATSYRLRVSTVSNFATTVYDQSGLTSTNQTVSLSLTSQTYYWQVNATNVGGTSSYSTTRSFTTIPSAPSAPTVTFPTTGSTGVGINISVIWNAVGGSDSYGLQLSTSPVFGSYVYNLSGLTGTSQAVTLLNSTTYYLRMNSTNVGGTGSFGSTIIFTTAAGAPVIGKFPTGGRLKYIQ